MLLAGLALWLDLRTCMALALALLLLLLVSPGRLPGQPAAATRWLAWLGQRSCALFLVHFPVLLMGNAMGSRSGTNSAVWDGAFVLAIWPASLLMAWAFERWVQVPLGQRLPRPTSAPAKA